MEANEIYKHYNIKLNIPPVYIGCHKLCNRVSTSIGIPYMKRILGKKRTYALIQSALESKQQSITVKLRSGGKLRFYAK